MRVMWVYYLSTLIPHQAQFIGINSFNILSPRPMLVWKMPTPDHGDSEVQNIHFN